MLRQRLIEAFVTKMNGVGQQQAAYAADIVLGVLQANGISTQIAAPGASGHVPAKGFGHGAPVQKGYVDQKMGHGAPAQKGYVDQKVGHGAPAQKGYTGAKGGHAAPSKGGHAAPSKGGGGYDPGKGGGGKY